MELLNDVEEIEEEECACRPEARHGHKREPVAGGDGSPVRRSAHKADETDQIHQLENGMNK